jgi:hypothetical protein
LASTAAARTHPPRPLSCTGASLYPPLKYITTDWHLSLRLIASWNLQPTYFEFHLPRFDLPSTHAHPHGTATTHSTPLIALTTHCVSSRQLHPDFQKQLSKSLPTLSSHLFPLRFLTTFSFWAL